MEMKKRESMTGDEEDKASIGDDGEVMAKW